MHLKKTVEVNGVQLSEPRQLHFFYDKGAQPIMVRTGGDEEECQYFTFVKNLQGDVLGILGKTLDSAGALRVEYLYDPWGRLLRSLTTAYDESAAVLAELNPFRYRGYLYDEESGLYYLRTRYYNPTWGRFMNADSIAGDPGVLLAHNLFVYCKSNPVMWKDEDGKVPTWGLVSWLAGRILVETRGDEPGKEIVSHWLFDQGRKLTKINEWNDYMFNNRNFRSRVTEYARKAIADRTLKINEPNRSLSLGLDEHGKGGYSLGYDLINGSNMDKGGFSVTGTVAEMSGGRYRAKIHYSFNDRMDPNGKYEDDVLAVIGAFILVGVCYDYDLEITGDMEFEFNY